MLADTDAGNIVTAAESGARWGYRLAPLLLLLVPVLIVVQDLAVRIGLFRQCGFGELVRERFGRVGAFVAAAALVVATLGSLVTELTGIAGVGELYGASRWLVLPLASLTLILVALTGEYRRVERVALLFGLFELSFLVVAWRSHPSGGEIIRDIADQKLTDFSYLYLGAGLIGATFNPWMIFYQASAVVEKRLSPSDYRAARWDTAVGAVLTQLVTASVLVAIAALKRGGTGASLNDIGEISQVLTPFLGEATGRIVFSAGVVGAAMAAAIVSSLACAWGLGEIFGLRRSLEREARHRLGFLSGYAFWVVGSAILVLFVPDLIWLSIGMQVLNTVLLPVVVALLVILAATALPESARLRGWRLWVTAGVVGLVAIAGVAGAFAGLL
ncbi:NRAMP family divalent metal transporter [Methylocapsa sp. S129]|uniref:NRAMP family divalent metal transporter n=1 Tax=Methylocapsa sp. S129 TaxID=1641869 RepID=UPI001AEEEAFE|nr:divalent metal cation transporter [Methylocapsa sp. S129]